MESLVIVYEKGKGYKLTIDGYSFERCVKSFSMEVKGSGAPVLNVELTGAENLKKVPAKTKYPPGIEASP